MEIAGRKIGGGAPCYVIAEAGANHNRDLDMARSLIDVAADAKADAVKFQVYSGKTLYSTKTPRFKYLEGIDDKETHEILEAAAMPREWLPELADYARSKEIQFFATPFDAAALGMEIIEKHFTLDRTLPGPDHPFAIEPDELRAMVSGIRDVEAALGHGRLEGPSEEEAGEMYRLARRSIIAATDIPAGTVIERSHLTVKRPGFGIAPKHIGIVVGRTAKVDIELDDIVTWEMV